MYYDFLHNLWRGRMAWFRRDSEDENRTVANVANELIIGAVDADFVRKVEQETGKNLRDQVSLQEMIDMRVEEEYLRMGHRRN